MFILDAKRTVLIKLDKAIVRANQVIIDNKVMGEYRDPSRASEILMGMTIALNEEEKVYEMPIC